MRRWNIENIACKLKLPEKFPSLIGKAGKSACTQGLSLKRASSRELPSFKKVTMTMTLNRIFKDLLLHFSCIREVPLMA
jgi:hypothetical protein